MRHTEIDYLKLSAEMQKYMQINRQLLSQVTDLQIANAKLSKELELYKAFSPDVSHELVARAKEKGEKVCKM